ncbi:MAG: M20 family metallo-hydrolase [Ignavibacteria bacterium]|nr:M20 family metallo-hydrolase [Ignavibacteria bacterium]
MSSDKIYKHSLDLLKKLIAIPSFSREADKTAMEIGKFFEHYKVSYSRHLNNIWAHNKYYDGHKPTILLNSHHDTVRPNASYTRDPFKPECIDGRLYGLGSNDAGGSLVALLATFLHFYDHGDLSHNLIIAATDEEEVSGVNGIESILPSLGPIDFAIVGEPTLCQLATAEKGLMVLDCVAKGKSGHAARNEGMNAIYVAMKDIDWIDNFRFPKVSPTLGEVKMTVTIINAGSQHNVVPDECAFTIDVRVTDSYTLEETLDVIRENVRSEVTPRALRTRSSSIVDNHPIVLSARKNGLRLFGSQTTSDQGLIPVPSVKIGPGDSARSHSADEFIYVDEIRDGIETYIKLLYNIIKV